MVTLALNGLMCEGLYITKANIEPCFFGDDKTNCDQQNIFQKDLKNTVVPTGGYELTDFGATAECRSMYDENDLDYKYCCQHVSIDSD